MIGKLECFVIDCEDVFALSTFYTNLMGAERTGDRADSNWQDLILPGCIPLSFQRVDHLAPPEWPGSEHPQRFHLDVMVDDMDTAQDQALALGAKLIEENGRKTYGFRVFADPSGHPFCLTRPRPKQ
jgi:catechol 2,3-dioxygenase-like lactoylglutathione lyase family enzyme